jgi:hypothetical protein
MGDLSGSLDEDHSTCPSGIGLDSKRTRPGEEIKDALAFDVAQDGEKGFSYAIARRPHPIRHRTEVAAFQTSADHSHGETRFNLPNPSIVLALEHPDVSTTHPPQFREGDSRTYIFDDATINSGHRSR